MAKQDNEGKALDAVLRFIEGRDNAPRKNDGWSPDDPKNPDADQLRRVDYVCTVGRLLYAFEHTRIEPFPNQFTDREVWDLIVPFDASVGLTGCKVEQVQDALIEWIETNAAHVPVVPLDWRYTYPHLTAHGVPFRFSLDRFSLQGYPRDSPLCGLFRTKTVAPADLDRQRAGRLKTASGRKSPKLAIWKQDSGARTVLVLEEDDLWLTNHFLVDHALGQAEANTPDAPDEVFMVSTGLDQTWWVVCLRGLGRVDGNPMPNREFDPSELTALTPRGKVAQW